MGLVYFNSSLSLGFPYYVLMLLWAEPKQNAKRLTWKSETYPFFLDVFFTGDSLKSECKRKEQFPNVIFVITLTCNFNICTHLGIYVNTILLFADSASINQKWNERTTLIRWDGSWRTLGLSITALLLSSAYHGGESATCLDSTNTGTFVIKV